MPSASMGDPERAWLQDCGAFLVVHNRHAKRGALTPEFYAQIIEAVDLARQERVRAIILTGGPFFCAGGDLQILKTRAALPAEARRDKIEGLHGVLRALRGSEVPIIAAVEGGAAGAGLSLALACDLIVAAREATFTAAYVKAGLTPDGGLTYLLSQQVPRQLAMEMCLLGQPQSAERLAGLGVVTTLCQHGQALEQAQVLAKRLSEGPRQAQSRIRRLLWDANDADFASHLDQEADFMAEAQGSSEAAEGIAAFFEKRKPVF